MQHGRYVVRHFPSLYWRFRPSVRRNRRSPPRMLPNDRRTSRRRHILIRTRSPTSRVSGGLLRRLAADSTPPRRIGAGTEAVTKPRSTPRMPVSASNPIRPITSRPAIETPMDTGASGRPGSRSRPMKLFSTTRTANSSDSSGPIMARSYRVRHTRSTGPPNRVPA